MKKKKCIECFESYDKRFENKNNNIWIDFLKWCHKISCIVCMKKRNE